MQRSFQVLQGLSRAAEVVAGLAKAQMGEPECRIDAYRSTETSKRTIRLAVGPVRMTQLAQRCTVVRLVLESAGQ